MVVIALQPPRPLLPVVEPMVGGKDFDGQKRQKSAQGTTGRGPVFPENCIMLLRMDPQCSLC